MISQDAAARGMSSSNKTKPSRKRLRSTDEEIHEPVNCGFCGQVAAAVYVQMPILLRKKRASTPFCLTCYYTSAAVRQEPTKFVTVCNREQVQEQLTPMQQLFSKAFVDLRKSLREEADRAFSKQKNDPLAMLHGGIAPRRMSRAPKPNAEKNKVGKASDGGFLRTVPLPERLLRTQQDQATLQDSQIARMNELAAGASTDHHTMPTPANVSNVYKRRKSSRKSIWNLAMDSSTNATDAQEGEEAARIMEQAPACSCGSQNVRAFGNITSRNQDLRKGETWGMKDRGDDVVSRYQCNDCGKTWNEEG